MKHTGCLSTPALIIRVAQDSRAILPKTTGLDFGGRTYSGHIPTARICAMASHVAATTAQPAAQSVEPLTIPGDGSAGCNPRVEVSPTYNAEARRAWYRKNAKEKSKGRIVPPRRQRSATYWGPIPLPGNKKGHLGKDDTYLILRRTGWKVTTRFRGRNKKGGTSWGGRMMSGRMIYARTEGMRHRSQVLAQEILLAQQETFMLSGRIQWDYQPLY